MVLETEVESLPCQAQERLLVEKIRLEKKQISLSFPNDSAFTDINGTKDLFPMGPLTITGGTMSGYPSESTIQDFCSLLAKEPNFVIQETRDTPTTITKEALGTKTPLEEECRRRKLSAMLSTETNKMYLILSSYA